MKKSDFFSDSIIAFAGKHIHDHLHDHLHDHIHDQSVSLRVVYYEWSKSENKWLKLRDSDPDPDQSVLPSGKFDGQIIEVEL